MKNWRPWVGILVSAVCLYLAIRGMDFGSLRATLSQMHYAFLLPILGVLVCTFLARAFRWRILLRMHSELRIGRLFNLVNIGYLVNHISPLRLGDLLRAYLCAQLESLSLVQILATVVIERIADTLVILLLLFCLVPFLALPTAVLRGAFGIGTLAAGILMLFALSALYRERSIALYERLAERVSLLSRARVRRMVIAALDGVSSLHSLGGAARVLVWSLVIWLGTAVEFYAVMWIIGLHLPFTAALTVLCLTSLGMVVPSSPGYIGVFEYITVVSLSLFSVEKEIALSYALVLHALSYLVVAILGLAGAWAEGYSYMRLREALNRVETDNVFT